MLIAVAVGAILFIGAASLIVPAVKISTQANRTQTAATLEKGLLDNVTAWAGGNWGNVLALATSSAHPYYLLTAQSPFVATSGVQSIVMNSTTFTRYFYVDDAFRDSGGNLVTSGGTDDPDTKQFTVVVNWPQGGTTTASVLLTRHSANAYSQTTWSGGGGASGPLTLVSDQFATSSNINYASGSLLLTTTSTFGAINSSTPHYWGWDDLIGWLDFWNNGNGVTVTSQNLTGYASSSAGDISLDCHTTRLGNICGQSDYQVANDGKGDLSGWGWNDTYGWISFSGANYQVTINASGTFHGYAWNDIVGWISFNCADNSSCGNSAYDVETTWTPSSPDSGYLESATFDTNSISSALNSVVWQGSQPASTTVGFQFAVSDASSDPWDFTGLDGTSLTYWLPLGPGIPLSLSYAYTGFRYFRYRVYLIDNGSPTGPQVNSVSVNWSP